MLLWNVEAMVMLLLTPQLALVFFFINIGDKPQRPNNKGTQGERQPWQTLS